MAKNRPISIAIIWYRDSIFVCVEKIHVDFTLLMKIKRFFTRSNFLFLWMIFYQLLKFFLPNRGSSSKAAKIRFRQCIHSQLWTVSASFTLVALSTFTGKFILRILFLRSRVFLLELTYVLDKWMSTGYFRTIKWMSFVFVRTF